MQFMTCDTEDDGKGHVYMIKFYSGKIFNTFYNKKDAQQYINTYPKRMRVFCVNLEYDLLNIYSPEELVESGTITFSTSRILSYKTGNIEFLNTLNHWQISVAEMGKIIGIDKLPFDPTSEEYCNMDCIIPYIYITKMLESYKKIGLDFKITVGSTALHHFMDCYCPIKMKKITNETLEKFREYYYGGRTECFFIGKKTDKDKNIRCIDINSTYPKEMLNRFPNPYIFENKTYIPASGFSLVDCVVRSNMKYPILPLRMNGKLCFPNGTFRGKWTSKELEYAKEYGLEILKINSVIHFPIAVQPFSGYVKKLYSERLKCTDIFDKIKYKLLLNCLYGKFGQGNEVTEIISVTEYLEKPESYKVSYPILDGKYKVVTKIDKYPKHTNFIWALYTTAYARIALHKLIMRVDAIGEVLYTDTDSVIYIGDELPGASTELGGFKEEYTTNSITIVDAKEYYYNDNDSDTMKYKVKGIPRYVMTDNGEKKQNTEQFQEYLDGNEITFKKPVKLRQSFRGADEGKANVWTDRKKKKGINGYTKGIVKNNGKIEPFFLTIN